MIGIPGDLRRISSQKDKPQPQSSHSDACILMPRELTSCQDLAREELAVLLCA
jgi:hypothetical protein